MKKIALLTSILVSFAFSQTGMLAPAQESIMGIWLNHGIYQIDNDEYDGSSNELKI